MGQLSVTNSSVSRSSVNVPASAAPFHCLQPSLPLPLGGFYQSPDPRVRERLTEALAPDDNVDSGQRFARKLAHGHYENFSVVSFLLPRHLRQDFCNVYAFCRIADDMADELSDAGQASAALAALRTQTLDCYAGGPRCTFSPHLAIPLPAHQIPLEPFLDLIDAFEQDQRVSRYQDLERSSIIAAAVPIRSAGWFCTCAATATSERQRFRTRPARRCSWPTSGRTFGAICSIETGFTFPPTR